MAPPPDDLLWSRAIALAAVVVRGDCPTPMPGLSVAGDGASRDDMFGV
jgi:hypothetical protein